MIQVLHEPATTEQIAGMLEEHESYLKLAVDIRQGILAGGGEFHADCETALLEEGSRREDVWGADWVPDERLVRYAALINIRPRVNPSIEIQDATVRKRVESIVRKLLHRS